MFILLLTPHVIRWWLKDHHGKRWGWGFEGNYQNREKERDEKDGDGGDKNEGEERERELSSGNQTIDSKVNEAFALESN